jgi:hypothetical protein
MEHTETWQFVHVLLYTGLGFYGTHCLQGCSFMEHSVDRTGHSWNVLSTRLFIHGTCCTHDLTIIEHTDIGLFIHGTCCIQGWAFIVHSDICRAVHSREHDVDSARH